MIINQLNKKSPYGDVTVNKLAEKFNVSKRQFRLDLGAVENDLRVPLIRRETGKAVGVSLEAGHLPSLCPEQATITFLYGFSKGQY